ncbi:DNA cytosine methyltransferase [Chitinimonas naiadis]
MGRAGAYYNEIDPYAAQWLRNLIAAGHIAPGDVDERSIEDVHPDDIRGYTQCHFFAGVGIWSYALRRAGWADDRPVWTGSCPCQPFSSAGEGLGFADERHLWPAFHHLIRELRPSVVFGEQVASKDAGPWIDLVQDDLEAMAYALGAVAFPSAGIGAPHIRDRLYWVAHAHSRTRRQGRTDIRGRLAGSDAKPRAGLSGGSLLVGLADAELPSPARLGPYGGESPATSRLRDGSADCIGSCRLADTTSGESSPGDRIARVRIGSQQSTGQGLPSGLADHYGLGQQQAPFAGIPDRQCDAESCSRALGMANSDLQCEQSAGNKPGVGDAWRSDEISGLADSQLLTGCTQHEHESRGRQQGPVHASKLGGYVQEHIAGPVNGLWRDADWLFCRDGKWRPVEPGTFPLAHGATSRVGRLRAHGNAINAEAAVAFIEAYGEGLKA